jgi:hypothetical protein
MKKKKRLNSYIVKKRVEAVSLAAAVKGEKGVLEVFLEKADSPSKVERQPAIGFQVPQKYGIYDDSEE